MTIWIPICLIIGYGCGCISTGYLVGKWNGIDIRDKGSGNAGATNALRTLGAKAGFLTFLGDVLKVVVPIVILRFLVDDADEGLLLALYMGLGAALGHNYPFWLHFKGGRGIAVTGGVIIAATAWWFVGVGALLFIAIVRTTKYVSLGSLVVAWYLPLYMLLFHRGSPLFPHILVVSLLFTALAYIKHWPNIKRLANGTENKFGGKKEGQESNTEQKG